jgi:hypothetical protein
VSVLQHKACPTRGPGVGTRRWIRGWSFSDDASRVLGGADPFPDRNFFGSSPHKSTAERGLSRSSTAAHQGSDRALIAEHGQIVSGSRFKALDERP